MTHAHVREHTCLSHQNTCDWPVLVRCNVTGNPRGKVRWELLGASRWRWCLVPDREHSGCAISFFLSVVDDGDRLKNSHFMDCSLSHDDLLVATAVARCCEDHPKTNTAHSILRVELCVEKPSEGTLR